MTPPGFDRLIEIPEGRLVETIFGDQILRRIVGAPPSVHGSVAAQLSLKPDELGLAPTAFGDVDALLVCDNIAEEASAVEFKRVKISASTLATGAPNKLGELSKAVEQANALHRAGFAYVWLTVIIVADMRTVTGGSGFAAPPLHLVHLVRDTIQIQMLAPEVGVTLCEITQVSDKPANERGGSGGQLLRHATVRRQPEVLTEGIRRAFAQSDAA